MTQNIGAPARRTRRQIGAGNPYDLDVALFYLRAYLQIGGRHDHVNAGFDRARLRLQVLIDIHTCEEAKREC